MSLWAVPEAEGSISKPLTRPDNLLQTVCFEEALHRLPTVLTDV